MFQSNTLIQSNSISLLPDYNESGCWRKSIQEALGEFEEHVVRYAGDRTIRHIDRWMRIEKRRFGSNQTTAIRERESGASAERRLKHVDPRTAAEGAI